MSYTVDLGYPKKQIISVGERPDRDASIIVCRRDVTDSLTLRLHIRLTRLTHTAGVPKLPQPSAATIKCSGIFLEFCYSVCVYGGVFETSRINESSSLL